MRVVDVYTFTPGGRGIGTVVVPEIFELEDIQRINNVTRGVPLYGVDIPSSGASVTVANGQTTVTFEESTTFCEASDELQILLYDGGNGRELYGANGAGATATSAFGEPIAVPITPVFQLDGIYGLSANAFEQYTNSTGSVTSGTLMTASTGSGAGGYGVVRSRRVVRYRPGQGALARFTAMFSTPLANYTQGAGFFSQEQALMVGYNGTSFGILRANGGKAHIHTLLVTGAGNGSETVTVTLNGTAFNVPVSGTTIADNTVTLANATYTGWTVSQSGNTVTFLSTTLGPKPGTFSVSTSAGGTFIGTMSVVQVGVNQTEVWIPQANWNIDRLDGTGPSGITLNPQTLNVYQINFRWLGGGEMRFAMENPNTGDMMFFHHIHFSNANTNVHLDNPSLKIGYVAADLLGSGTGSVSTSGASILGAIEGLIQTTEYPTAATGTRTTNMNTGSIYHVLTVRNNPTASGKINTREIICKKLAIGATAASSASCFIYLYLAPTYSAAPYYETVSNFSSKSTTPAALIGDPIAVFTTTTGSPTTIDLDELRIVLPAGQALAIGISSTATLQRADAALTYIED